MATKFISVITDEAMQKICYTGGGWTLSPYQFAISETNLLGDIPPLDSEGNVTQEAYDKLKSMTSADMYADLATSSKWCQRPFEAITKTNATTLGHHVVVPADWKVSTNKKIKAIYFLYQAEDGEIFLYGIALAVEDIIYEKGITQSLLFNFSVANERTVDEVNFVVNYTYPSEINDHNTSEDVHDNLVRRDGSKTITGTLMYSGDRNFTSQYQLVSKAYVDNLIAQLKANNNLK